MPENKNVLMVVTIKIKLPLVGTGLTGRIAFAIRYTAGGSVVRGGVGSIHLLR
jgi:hypothetical protein